MKSSCKPTSIFHSEENPFEKIIKPKVKSLKKCTLAQSHHSGLQAALAPGLKCKLHTTTRKTHLRQANRPVVKKDSIQTLIEKSRFSLEKVIGKCFTPENKLENHDENKENIDPRGPTTNRKRCFRGHSAEKKRKNCCSSNNKEGACTRYTCFDCPHPQKKVNLASDEQVSKLHTLIHTNKNDNLPDAGSFSTDKTTSSSPEKTFTSDFTLGPSGHRIMFPTIQNYEIQTLCPAETSLSPNEHDKTWIINDGYTNKEMNYDLLDFGCSHVSMTTRANSFEIFYFDSADLFCFAPVKPLEGIFQAEDDNDDDELGCEETVDPDILSSAKKEAFDAEFEDKDSEFVYAPLIKTSSKDRLIDENHFDFLEAVRVNQLTYNVESDYLKTKQPETTEEMRAILIDWMIEVCASSKMKRDTLYIAVSFLNKYLSIVPNIPKWKIQLVGVTSLLLAAKSEEIHPKKMRDFATEDATEEGYTVMQIREMELEMCKILQWRLNPITSYRMANYLMLCWDKFMGTFEESHLCGVEKSEFYFKQANIKSYIKFREVVQILDLLLLDTRTLQYDMIALVVSIIYLVMGQASQKITRDDIINYNISFKDNKKNAKEFDEIFVGFLKVHLHHVFEDLETCIQYIRPYFSVSFSFESPSTIKENAKLEYKGHYEDFLSSQTHCPLSLSFIKGMLGNK